ncbi:MAG: glycosyltransferase [Candidatus Omnitrophica bacterium CG11_big_fil_rev_8_21_14_0_20_64_10]|nr:MAG: glycosyltransferase [Candidatus Omnitrophica bacterium CG11_big_fil_rev_8_21_14_0_20_64_10]
MTRLLYLSYDGLLDPLGQSQILPYLFRLTGPDRRWTVVSFEKPGREPEAESLERRLREAGIRWIRLRYHRRPPIGSTVWDLAAGWWTVRRACRNRPPEVLHARSYVAALLALWLKRPFESKFLFDIRGFWPDEKVEGGFWKAGGWLYRITKRLERRFFEAADHIVTLTDRSREILEQRFQTEGIRRPITVIPTCADLERFRPAQKRAGGPLRLVYAGSAGGAYLLPEMADFFRAVRRLRPDTRWEILSPRPDPQIETAIAGLDSSAVTVRILSHDQVAGALAGADASLCLIRPVSSKTASCPTKIGESLACGLPVVVTAGIGDCDRLIGEGRVGVVLSDCSEAALNRAARELLALLAEGETLWARCRRAAESCFDLGQGVRKYQSVYRQLIESAKSCPNQLL